MITGLGLRVIPSDSPEDVAAAIPIDNEVMVTADEGRVHSSQTGIPDADAPLRALPFKDEVMLIDEGSAQGLTEHLTARLLESHKHVVILAKDGSESIVSDLGGKGTVSLINTASEAVLGALIPLSHVSADKFGLILAASDDLGVVAVANDVRAVSIFIRSGDSYTEALAYTEASVGITSLAVSGDGSTVAVGYSDKSNLTGEIKIYRVDAGTAAIYQTLLSPTAVAGERFGSALALSYHGVMLAAGLKGDASGKGAVITFGDNATLFSEVQKLSVANAVIGDSFGSSVDLSNDGSLLVIGASGRTYSGETVDFNSGAVFVANKLESGLFRIDQELKSADAGGEAGLGGAVALSGDKSVLMAGAKTSSFSGASAGLVVTYTANDGVFSRASLLELTGSNANGYLGQSISIDHKGRQAAIGSAKGIMLALSKSSWQKSIPEVTGQEVASGSDKQGSVSGKVIKDGIKAEIDAIHEVSQENIKTRSKVGGKVSGFTLAEEFDRIEAVAASAPPSIDAMGLTATHPNRTSGYAAPTINEVENTAIIDYGADGKAELFVDEVLRGDWTIEVGLTEDSATPPNAALKISLADGENVFVSFNGDIVMSSHENSNPLVYIEHWPDFNRANSETLLIGLRWSGENSATLMMERQDEQYAERTLTFAAPVPEQKATVSMQFGIVAS